MKRCAHCGLELPETEFKSYNKSYCLFCRHRMFRIQRTFMRAKQIPPTVLEIHRAHYYWRRTPELDALYLNDEPNTLPEAA